MDRLPNLALTALLNQTGCSRGRVARRMNELAADAGIATAYTHTSLAGWERRGVQPQPETARLLVRALSEYLARPVTLSEAGLSEGDRGREWPDLAYARDLTTAVHAATDLWSAMRRRELLTSSGAFVASYYLQPLARWLIQPEDPASFHRGDTQVTAGHIAVLNEAADNARAADSRWGGGDPRTLAAMSCLDQLAAPMLRGQHSGQVSRDLYAACAELSRVVGFALVDTGQHRAAQRHLSDALRLAAAAGDVTLGGYVVATMALHEILRGQPDLALDLAQGALCPSTAGDSEARRRTGRCPCHRSEPRGVTC